MSSPMYDAPEHRRIGVNAMGQGPVMPDEPGYQGEICWCSNGEDCVVLPPRWVI